MVPSVAKSKKQSGNRRTKLGNLGTLALRLKGFKVSLSNISLSHLLAKACHDDDYVNAGPSQTQLRSLAASSSLKNCVH